MATKKEDTNLLPEDTADGAEDFSNIRVDFSSEEAGSEGRSFDPIPSGKYPFAVTDWSMEKCGPNSKNPGKPFWHLELTVQGGEYDGRKLWANVMLFNGALYSLAQLEKALFGVDISEGSYTVRSGDELLGKEGIAIVRKQVDKYAIDQGEWDGKGPKPMKNEVKGYMALDQVKAGDGSGSLLPG